MRRIADRPMLGMWSAAVLGLCIGCSSTPPAEDPELSADPPIGQGVDSGGANQDLDRGVAHIKNERFAEAIPLLEKALEADPQSAMATFYLATAHEMTGEKDKAIEGYKTALALDEKLVEAASNLAAIYLDDPPRPDDAIAILQRALTKAPDDALLRQNLAYAYGLKGDVDAASEHYETILKKKDDPLVRFAYGSLLFDAKKVKDAVVHLKKAVAGDEAEPAMLVTVARMMGYAKAFEDCVALFDRAIAKKGDDPEWYVRRGTCKHSLKDEEGAGADFAKSVEVDDKFAAGHYYLGVSLLAQKKPKEAKKALEKAASTGGDSKIGKMAKAKLKSLK